MIPNDSLKADPPDAPKPDDLGFDLPPPASISRTQVALACTTLASLRKERLPQERRNFEPHQVRQDQLPQIKLDCRDQPPTRTRFVL